MAIANPRIHIICGICGSNKFFNYKISKYVEDDTQQEKQAVVICCDNCTSLTYLDELIPEKS